MKANLNVTLTADSGGETSDSEDEEVVDHKGAHHLDIVNLDVTKKEEAEAVAKLSLSPRSSVNPTLSLKHGLTSLKGEELHKRSHSVGGPTSVLRTLVSKKKKRFNDGIHDLDLSYISYQIIAMGFPSLGTEKLYRNPMEEVEQFFDTNHKDNYMIYNLCSERDYNDTYFHGNIRRFPFDDHNPPPLRLLFDFCKEMDTYLSKDGKNVAGVHCKAGKGRTGTVICAYLVYNRICLNSNDAFAIYAVNRTYNRKGVTIPSQQRYVRYLSQLCCAWDAVHGVDKEKKEVEMVNNIPDSKFGTVEIATFDPSVPIDATWVPGFNLSYRWPSNESLLGTERGSPPEYKNVFLTGITISSIPKGGCVPTIKFINYTQNGMNETGSSTDHYESQEFKSGYHEQMHFYFGPDGVEISGDVKFHCSCASGFGSKKLFICWINTLFIVDGSIVLTKSELDGAHKDKKHKLWPSDMNVEFHFASTIEEARTKSSLILETIVHGPKVYRSLRAMLTPRARDRSSILSKDAWKSESSSSEPPVSASMPSMINPVIQELEKRASVSHKDFSTS